MNVTSLLRAPAKVYYGWWVVAAGAGIVLTGSVYFYGFTVFFLPMSRELGLNRAATSAVFALARLEGGLEGPLVGLTIDRVGVRRVLLAGGLLAGVGFLVLSRVESFLTLMLVYAGLIALGFNMGFFPAMMVSCNTWFIRHRSLAMSIIAASFRAGGAFLIPLIAWAVLHYGWRFAAAMTGVIILATTVPLSFVVRRSPEAMGLLPDGAKPDDPVASRPGVWAREKGATGLVRGRRSVRLSAVAHDATVREAFRMPAYWVLAAASALRMAAFSGTVVHMVPMLVWRGQGELTAANVVAAMAFVSMPLTLLVGWLADRRSKFWIMISGSAASGLAAVVLINATNMWLVWVFVGTTAFGESIGPVQWGILGDLFGRKNFATLRGFITGAGIMGAGMPIYMGWVFDRTESYTLALVTVAVLSGAAAALYLVLMVLSARRAAPAPPVVAG